MIYIHMYILFFANGSTENKVRPSDEVAGGKEPTQLTRTLGREEKGNTTKN